MLYIYHIYYTRGLTTRHTLTTLTHWPARHDFVPHPPLTKKCSQLFRKSIPRVAKEFGRSSGGAAKELRTSFERVYIVYQIYTTYTTYTNVYISLSLSIYIYIYV